MRRPDNHKARVSFKQIVQRRESAMFIFLVLILVGMSVARPDTFFSTQNFVNILKQISLVAIIAVGQTFIMITGGIDLSVGYSLGLGGIVMTKFMSIGMNSWGAILVGVLTCVLIGLLNGLFITRLNLPPFIVTMGMANIARGLTYIITQGFPISTNNGFVLALGNNSIGMIPIMAIIMLVIVAAAVYLLGYTSFGTRILSIGGNETATMLSGINVKRYKVLVYSLAGLLCGIAGVIMVGRLNAGNPNAGNSFDMDTIAATIVGGTALSGGEGTVVGTLFGALLLGIIKNSLVMLDVNMYWQTVAVGAIIILVCAVDYFAQSKKKK